MTGTGQVLASPAQEGQPGQPGQGPCTGALLSPPGQYLYCTRPIYVVRAHVIGPLQSGTGQPGSGPGTGLRTRYRAQDPVQALYRAHIHVYRPCTGPIYTYTGPEGSGPGTGLPALGNDSFPLTNAGSPILGWGRGISPRPRVLGRISSTKYSGLPCSMSRLGSSGPARARARNDLVLAVLGLSLNKGGLQYWPSAFQYWE